MELYLIRHGQSRADIEGKCEGAYDSPLTPLGICQAEKLRDYFASRNVVFDTIFTSPLSRAWATATIIPGAQRCRIIVDPRLRDRDNGAWAGMPKAERDLRYPKTGKPPFYRDFHEPLPGGESYADLAKRVHSFWSWLSSEKRGDRLAIVSHGGCLAALISTLFNGGSEPLREYPAVIVPANDTGWHLLRWQDGGIRLLAVNRREHLD